MNPLLSILRFYYLSRATLWLLLAFGRAAWYFRWRAPGALDVPVSLAMTAGERRRWKHYFYGSTYLAVLMCSLRGQPRSRRETFLFSNLAALAAFFDDQIDAIREGADAPIEWPDNPETFSRVADKRGLTLLLLQNIYQSLPQEQLEQFRGYMHRVFNVEMDKRQTDSNRGELSLDALIKITAEKGGCSVLLFRSVMSHSLSEMEEHAFYQFGCLIQCCDDIFDLWHDRQAGTVTLATFLAERGEIELLEKLFEDQVTVTQQAFHQTDYAPFLVATALNGMHYLVSTTRVCLWHYLNLKRTFGSLNLDDRTSIVVDMGNWANRFRVIGYLLRPIW